MAKNGISLIECLIYLFLSTLVITLSMTVFSNFYSKINNSFVNLKETIDLALVLNNLIKDITNSSCDFNNWPKTNKNYIIFFNNKLNKNIGWFIKDQKIFRYSGNYKNNKWHKFTSNVIANKISCFKAKLTKSKNIIKNIDFKIKKAKVSLNFCIAPIIDVIK